MFGAAVTPSTPLTADRPAGPATDFDTRAFRNALGSFPTGVAIITTIGEDGRPIGLTCNSFSSVSLEPPLVSWSLRTASKSLDTFRQSGAFAINILAEDI
jgi:flavin reductase (DIM6/NTAB) family NADH-FMN oxidoreductase RutF